MKNTEIFKKQFPYSQTVTLSTEMSADYSQ